MAYKEPTGLEIWLTNIITYCFLRRKRRKYARSLELTGDEKVLDYGSGNGGLSGFIAKELSAGGYLSCVDVSRKWQNVIRKKLGGSSNVDFFTGTLGEYAASGAERGTFDAVNIHFVLHDIPAEERQGKLIMLAEFLKAGGNLYIKEPIREGHGMSTGEIRELCKPAGFYEISGHEGKNAFTGVFKKR